MGEGKKVWILDFSLHSWKNQFDVVFLQVFYRLHVSVMKYILRASAEPPLEMMKTYLVESLESPFAKCKEKKWERGRSVGY